MSISRRRSSAAARLSRSPGTAAARADKGELVIAGWGGSLSEISMSREGEFDSLFPASVHPRRRRWAGPSNSICSLTHCGGSLSSVTVTINRHKVAQIGQDDLTAANSSIANLQKFAFQQGAGLATLVMQDILTLCTTSNFAQFTAVAAASVDIPQLRRARLLLNQADVPATNRLMLLDCVPMDALFGITNFLTA